MKPLNPAPISRRERGVALVIVLSVLVLMSALLVAFMHTVSTERLSQRAAYTSYEAQQAAESAVNLVISQIRAATSQADDGSVGWASQPGAIRTFGASNTVYKLYSSGRMQVSEGDYNPASPMESGITPGSPQTAPDAGFVDLNQPVLIPTAEGRVDPHYPIVDPRAALTRENSVSDPATKSASGRSRVEGFWVPQDMKHPSRMRDTAGVEVMELPMRVRWLYHLRDGTIVAPEPGTQRLRGASKENPPVARVAFWTDDESSKLNINTAGENTYWDTPMASGYQESGAALSPTVEYGRGESAALAASQPSAREYQRFPGHPATTNLSPALRWLFPTATDSPRMSDEEFKLALYRLTPRLQDAFGSSMAGTRANYDSTLDYRLPKRDRLFATVDEFWFRPDRSPISGTSFFGVFRESSPTPTIDRTFVHPRFGSPQALEQLRFFLTASSRAPDLNMFGLPRVCIWPVHEVDNSDPKQSKRTGFDDLIVFCSTIAGKPYYFTRAQPWSPTYDYETSGTKPGDITKAFPGRNKKLVLGDNGNSGYLRRLAGKNIPGVGGSFAAKYNSVMPPVPVAVAQSYTEIDRILLTIFDYIRCVNLVDTGRKDDSASNQAGYPLAYTPGYSPSNPPRYGKGDRAVLGSGQVVPSVIYTGSPPVPVLKGFGRFINLSEVSLLFYRDNSVLPGETPVPSPGAGEEVIPFRCVLLPETITVSAYYPGMSEGYAYRVRESNPFMISDPNDALVPPRPLELARGDLNFVDVNPWRIEYGRFWMPTRAFNNQFWTETGGLKAKTFFRPNNTNTPVDYTRYPFFSKRFDLKRKTNGPEAVFKLEAGTLEFEFYPLAVSEAATASPPVAPPANLGSPLQRVTVTFPPVTLRVPKPGTPFQNRIQSQASDGGRGWVTTADIIRSMEPNGHKNAGGAHGDHRMIAAHTFPPETLWGTSGSSPAQYADRTIERLHNFRSGWGRPFSEARWATLSPNGNQRTDKYAKVPGYNGTAISFDGTAAGDFDRGNSKHIDGAFINKPDEGNTRFNPSDDPNGGGYLPYYRGGGGYEEVGETFFSPNRLLPSAVMFGSLPSGVFARRPWETLLFSPPTSAGHRGAVSPPDHYMLDWFTMPVVEPYAISEPLATMGKINLNSRLAPFGYVKVSAPGGPRSYIQRHTGLYGIFKNMRQFAAGPAAGTNTGGHRERPLEDTTSKFRWEVDPQAMMDDIIDPALDDRKFFKSATEVCELDLPLKNSFAEKNGNAQKWKPRYNDLPGRRAFWAGHDMTGDNARERPYAHVYPRLTTKSNVYTIHFWAQSLAKRQSSTEWDLFDEATDRVLGEYRGSTTVERYIDVDDTALENYDAVEQSEAKSLDPYYRFRIVNHKRFNPQ